MFSYQLGQVLPGTILSLSLFSGLGLTASPVISDFIAQSEKVALKHAHSALKTSLKINYLLSSMEPSHKLIVEGLEVSLKNGYPIADKHELEKIVDFGTQILDKNTKNQVTVWSMYRTYCFTYQEAEGKKTASVGDIALGTSKYCELPSTLILD